MPGEFDLIAQIRRLAAGSPIVSTGIGDDCASLKLTPGRELLVTTDMLMDGRHFHLSEAGAAGRWREGDGCQSLRYRRDGGHAPGRRGGGGPSSP